MRQDHAWKLAEASRFLEIQLQVEQEQREITNADHRRQKQQLMERVSTLEQQHCKAKAEYQTLRQQHEKMRKHHEMQLAELNRQLLSNRQASEEHRRKFEADRVRQEHKHEDQACGGQQEEKLSNEHDMQVAGESRNIESISKEQLQELKDQITNRARARAEAARKLKAMDFVSQAVKPQRRNSDADRQKELMQTPVDQVCSTIQCLHADPMSYFF